MKFPYYLVSVQAVDQKHANEVLAGEFGPDVFTVPLDSGGKTAAYWAGAPLQDYERDRLCELLDLAGIVYDMEEADPRGKAAGKQTPLGFLLKHGLSLKPTQIGEHVEPKVLEGEGFHAGDS